MEKLYYTIGEAASLLGENASLVRFWTTRFEKFLKPRRNAKGNRLYTQDDLEVLKQLHLLIKENGMTLDGAEKRLAAERPLARFERAADAARHRARAHAGSARLAVFDALYRFLLVRYEHDRTSQDQTSQSSGCCGIT